MADNISVFTASGSAVSMAADEISSVFYPRWKLVHGADGVNAGDVARSNGLPTTQAQASAYEAIVSIAFGSIGASYANASLTGLSTACYVYVWNDTDAGVFLSFDAGTTTHAVIPARAARMIRVKAGATALWQKRVSANSAGTCYFEVIT